MRIEMKPVVAFAIAAACFAAVRAQAAPAENAAAKAAFVEGERDFQLGKFDAAIDAYERAFGLDPQPAFLFNIALAHRRQYEIDGQIEHLARARELYRNYLKLEPHSNNRAGVEKLIAELTAKIEQARSRPEPPPAAPVATAPIAPLAAPPATGGEVSAPAAPSLAEKTAPAAEHPAATLSAQTGTAASAGGSSRKWIIGGTIVAAVIVAAIAIFFATRSEASFDGPGVNVTPNMR
jgi:tetratricopeptide (TPR) repeat protein